MSTIKLKNVSKFYYNNKNISSGFSKINLELNAGEFVVITGESGSGKSTLLNVISGLDTYEEGELYINDEETSHYSETDYENYRRKYIGNIFQNFNLVNSYTVYQNVELVLILNGYKKREVKKRVLDVIKTVGLEKYKNTKASKLSGGQKQRVAIARALVKDTPIIVADEPTGNIDVASAKEIMKLLYEISKEKLVVIVTHNYEQVEQYATRKITMHDGKIIEDQVLKEKQDVELTPSICKNIRPINKLLLGIRNAFNIKTKFILLVIVYMVLTLFVFTSYSSRKKIEYDNGLFGGHPFFSDLSVERIILNKNDKSPISEEDFNKLNKLDNISRVVKDDVILDQQFNLYDEVNSNFFYGNIKSINEIKDVDEGEMPKEPNEMVLGISPYDWYDGDIINNDFTLTSQNETELLKLKLVGIKKIKDSIDSHIYVSDETFDKLRKYTYIDYSKMELKLEDNIYIKDIDGRLYYNIKTTDKINEGEAALSEEFNMYCDKERCINKYISIKAKNIYYEDSIDLKITNIFNKKSFTRITGVEKDRYDEFTSTVFINPNTYEKLFTHPTYQASVFIKDTKASDKTIAKLKEMGFNTYYMKDMMKETNEQMNGILNVIRTILFIIAIVVLFFISYFIIKIILKSRNIYFSTIRTLGATKKTARSLLNIELLVDINFVYILFITFIYLVTKGIIKQNYISDMITYFTIKDYIIIYIVLVSMSLLISTRYSRKLFKDSVMNTFREEL